MVGVWLVASLLRCFVASLVGSSVLWFVGSLAALLAGVLAGWSVGWLAVAGEHAFSAQGELLRAIRSGLATWRALSSDPVTAGSARGR